MSRQVPFPVENLTHEDLPSLFQQSYINNYYRSQPVTYEMEGRSNSTSIKNSLTNQSYDIDASKSKFTPPSAGMINNNHNQDELLTTLNDPTNMQSKADYETELLEMERPLDILTDTLDGSLLCTPSCGVLINEPMSVEDEILELEN